MPGWTVAIDTQHAFRVGGCVGDTPAREKEAR